MREKNKKPIHSLAENIRYILGLIIRKDKVLLLYVLLTIVCGVALSYFSLYLPRLIIDLLTREGMDARRLVLTFGGFALTMAGVMFLSDFTKIGQYMRYNSLRIHLIYLIFYRSLTCDYALIERAEGKAAYQKALHETGNGDQAGFNMIMSELSKMVINISAFLLYSGVVAVLHPVIVAILLASALLHSWVFKKVHQYREKLMDEQGPPNNRLNYISRITADPKSGKDIRVYGLRPLFLALRDQSLDGIAFVQQKSQASFAAGTILGAALVLLRDGAAYVYLIRLALMGGITAGEFVFYFGAIAGFAGWVSQLIHSMNTFDWGNTRFNHLRAFLDMEDAPAPSPTLPLPVRSQPAVEFDGVDFAYEAGGAKVLDGFSLSIAPGEKVALVGVNGAGKTTLVKLLCGFYQPSKGTVRIGGVDIRQVEKEALFAQFSAVFQEPALLPMTIAENISLHPINETDMARVRTCLSSAGLMDDVDALPKGLLTPLLRVTEEDGIQLSGGQTQKLLLARALYKGAPLLVLDEPTAALDPIAESHVYEQYHLYAKDKTSLFISHRLASTRFCNRIVLLKNGKPHEVGTHDELMRLGGEYAHMFETQSQYYRDDFKGGALHAKTHTA